MSLFSTADAQGPWRRVTICGVPAACAQLIGGGAEDVSREQPALAEQLPAVRAPAARAPVEQLLDTRFGSCNFNALPTVPPPDSGGGLPILGDLPLPSLPTP